MKGYGAKCLGDYNAKTTVGNKIVIWTCTAGAAQNITFAANSELLVVNGCVTGATTAVLGKCAGATSQEWTRRSNGEYVLKSNGKCLTAPSANNGTQLTLAACANTANQHWSLP
jgi:O-acetyl-ADP-ribose deacetylase (regulator of RNase III)